MKEELREDEGRLKRGWDRDEERMREGSREDEGG
jgi:hypothetical protein